MIRLLCSFLATGFIILAGCSSDNNPADSNGIKGPILPLKVGNQWIGTFSDFDTSGAVIETSTLAFRVSRDTTIGGEQWFIMEYVAEGGEMVVRLAVVTERSDGIWVWYDPLHEGGEAHMFYKYPATKGNSYPTHFSPSGTHTVVATNDRITVPHGVYTCCHYQTEYTKNVLDQEWHMHTYVEKENLYLAPGVGFVKMQDYERRGLLGPWYDAFYWELDSLDLK